MPTDRQFRVSGRWALASDGLQWVLQRRKGKQWEGVKFIRSTKAHLAYRMKGQGMPPEDVERLLDGLPDTFDEWNSNWASSEAFLIDRVAPSRSPNPHHQRKEFSDGQSDRPETHLPSCPARESGRQRARIVPERLGKAAPEGTAEACLNLQPSTYGDYYNDELLP